MSPSRISLGSSLFTFLGVGGALLERVKVSPLKFRLFSAGIAIGFCMRGAAGSENWGELARDNGALMSGAEPLRLIMEDTLVSLEP